jgi:hypothetical protein
MADFDFMFSSNEVDLLLKGLNNMILPEKTCIVCRKKLPNYGNKEVYIRGGHYGLTFTYKAYLCAGHPDNLYIPGTYGLVGDIKKQGEAPPPANIDMLHTWGYDSSVDLQGEIEAMGE